MAAAIVNGCSCGLSCLRFSAPIRPSFTPLLGLKLDEDAKDKEAERAVPVS